AAGDRVDLPLSVTLESATDTFCGVTDWAALPSALYKVVIAPADAAMADTLVVSDVALFRASDAMPPMSAALWVPETKINSGDNLLIGTSWSDSHIRYVLWTPDSVIERRWLTPSVGNFTVPVSLPDGVDDATLTLWTLRDYELTTRSVSVKRADAVRSLRLQISSLRTNVIAGDREQWTITVTDNLGRPVNDAAVVLDVYAKALDALRPHSLDLHPMSGARWAYGVLSGNLYDQYSRSARYPAMPQLPPAEAIAFNTFGRSWPRFHTYYVNGAYRGRGNAVMYKAMATADNVEAEEAVVEDCAEAVSYLADAGATTVVTGATSEAEESYRMPELPLALWNPVIATDADGFAQVCFTVPDANTTWAVKALAYDSDLLTGAFGTDFIASKPVMVQGSFPRFLRQGDSLTLLAAMINSTDSVQSVGGFMEVFDPVADTLIQRAAIPAEALGARASRVLSLPLSVGSVNLIGVRARATAGDFTDGEQAIIPVLPATVSVTEATPVIMDADSASLSLDVKPGSVVEFTANAAWECVLALPGLRDSHGKSALSAVAELYSAAVADGLLRSYPAIGLALASWERSDSVLVSRLQKNEDLKIALLENTPWVQSAESDTERMARLTLLLDRRNTSRSISSAVHTLGKLVRQGGGFAWTADGTEADYWVTMQVLRNLASLRQMGYLPDNAALGRLITDAVKYLDKTVASNFVKSPKSNYSDYVQLRSAFSDIALPTTARRVVNATVQRLVGDWRDLGFSEQARAAMILNTNGYPSTARLILESLRQHGAWRQTGVTADVLRAFAAVEPGCADVERIRLFLLSRKQTMDWGSGLQISNVISSILTSGVDWLVPAANSLRIAVDGREVDVAPESVCGSFRLDLPDGGHVDITKGRFPAWGGVWTCTEALGDTVEA
ncbi:MAG: hypothetical protein K2M97_02980, partial [Muribaculaceae bacterium]|nr:hypothetical protein [Muribaculaceae bacterium]